MPEFTPLATFLRTAQSPHASVEDAPSEDDALELEPPAAEVEAACAAARRFRAALEEALEAAVAAIVRDVAADVLARELASAPADLRAIVGNALRRYGARDLVRVRAHPDETALLSGLDLTIVADSSLRRGDVEIDLRGGTVDATLGARLASILPA